MCIRDSGNLDPERVWRTVMDDDRVFRCADEENHPSFTVDLLDVYKRQLLGIGFDGFTVNINDRRILRGMLELSLIHI